MRSAPCCVLVTIRYLIGKLTPCASVDVQMTKRARFSFIACSIDSFRPGGVSAWWVRTANAAASVALASAPTPPISELTNTEALGQLIYTRYVYLFQAAGMVLLVAMIGAIVLTHRTRSGVRKQRIGDQLARTREEAVELKQVSTGEGV